MGYLPFLFGGKNWFFPFSQKKMHFRSGKCQLETSPPPLSTAHRSFGDRASDSAARRSAASAAARALVEGNVEAWSTRHF